MTSWNDFDRQEAGRALGHDIYTQSLIPRCTSWAIEIRHGFDAAVHARLRRHRGDRFTAKWLQLRMSAWRRGRIVAQDVTPQMLMDIDVDRCPVTRELLTHGTMQDTDWSIDRLNNDAAYAASNLAVMSVRANRAKGSLSFAQVHARSKLDAPTDGLTPAQWLRLAVLMLGPAFATQPHDAPVLPLCAPLPTRSVRLAVQQIQRLFTEHCARHAGKNRLIREFESASLTERSRFRLAELGQAVHEGLKQTTSSLDRWDVWLQPDVLQALTRWQVSMDESGWRRAAAISGHLSLARRETPVRLTAWSLPTRGFLTPSASPLRQVW